MKELPEELEIRIAAYIDGELPPAEAARLEVFLANTDPQLAQQVIGMLADRHITRGLPRAAAPADLSARIMEQVERASLLNDVDTFTVPHRAWWNSRLTVAAALLLVLSTFTYFIIHFVYRGPETRWHAVVSIDGRHPPAVPEPTLEPATDAAASEPDALASTARSAFDAPAPLALHPMAKSAVSRANAAAQTEPQAAAPDAMTADAIAAEQTVQLTLLATDAGDDARLRSALEDFLARDADAARRQADLPNATFARTQSAQNNAEEPFVINEPTRRQQSQFNDQSQSNAPQPSMATPSGPQMSESPYHILLRPAQLHELTHQFTVQTLTRGPAAANTLQTTSAPAGQMGAIAAASAPDTWLDCTITLTPAPHQQSHPLPSPATAPATTQSR